jgi:hypothetical protein
VAKWAERRTPIGRVLPVDGADEVDAAVLF